MLRPHILGWVFAVLASIGSAQAQERPPDSAVRIVIEPDFLVSQDGDVPHIETMIAANPKDPRNLLGASIVGGRPGGGFHCKTYASHDGGRSWVDRSFPELVRAGGGDPQVGFTPLGTGLFTCLAFVTDDRGRTRAALYAWRSEDGGLTWSKPADLGVSYDHEMLVVDHTKGRFSGRGYLSALYGKHYTLGLFRSTDDGRTWTGPVEITNGGDRGVNVTNMVVLSDGELLLTWIDFPVTPKQESGWPGSHFWSATSKDGGVTFSAPRQGPALGPGWGRGNPDIRLHSDPGYAADPSEARRDRLYMVWTQFGANHPRLVFARSDDRGATWSAPVRVDPATPAAAKQFMPRIAVNRAGTIGVSFFDSRESKDGTAWHEYFTASVDGGDTFVPPARVSSELSRPAAGGNDRLEPSVFTEPGGGIQLALISGASRWSNGGDYLGLTADSVGVFHPLWADARTGTYQVWTARIRVDRPPLPEKPSPLDEIMPPERPPAALVRPTGRPADLGRRVNLVFDPTHYDPSAGELELHVRLENASRDSIFAPIRVEVRDFGSGLTREDRENAPTILNATNGKPGVGAVFDFGPALGTELLLPPGQRSGAVKWRIKLTDPKRTPSFHLVATGVVR